MRIFGIVLNQTDLWLLGIAISLCLALIGFYLSNTLNRRNDRNKAADIIAVILRKERINPTPESRIDFSDFRRVLKGRELTSFDSCVEEYERAKKNTAVKFREEPDYIIAGSGSYQNITSVVEALDRLLKFIDRK
ncbi:MAG: hypothetical protein PHH28_11775 [Desulfuromonadaceae bacterium]|nr:hypothetical protein [Desulfuromonadaceae bacterium]